MANKLYNQKKVASRTAVTGDINTGKYTYRGFSSNQPTKNFKIYDIALVKQDLINHFHIRKGEKLEKPGYGTIIWDMLFEPMTENNKNIIIKDVETIVNSDPRIAIQQVTVDATQVGIQVIIDAVYLPFNVSEKMAFTFSRDNNLLT